MKKEDYDELKQIFERMVVNFANIENTLQNISDQMKILIDEYRKQNI